MNGNFNNNRTFSRPAFRNDCGQGFYRPPQRFYRPPQRSYDGTLRTGWVYRGNGNFRGQGQRRNIRNMQNVHCYYCKNYGHMKRDCRKLERRLRGGGRFRRGVQRWNTSSSSDGNWRDNANRNNWNNRVNSRGRPDVNRYDSRPRSLSMDSVALIGV
jgi:hypothetical protein